MSKTDLTKVDMFALPVVGLGAKTGALETLAKSESYLKRIQLYTRGKAIDTGLITPGAFGIPGKENIKNLGQEIDIIPLVSRAKAVDMRDKDAIVTSYDEDCEVFKEIKELSEVKDSKCMWGFTFLVYERSTSEYYEMFLNNKSGRNESPNIAAYLPRTKEQEAVLTKELGHAPTPSGPCTLKSKYVTRGNWGWHVPVTYPCSTPFKGLVVDKAVEQITKFMSHSESEIEKAPDAPTTRAQ